MIECAVLTLDGGGQRGKYVERDDCNRANEWIRVVEALLKEAQPEFIRDAGVTKTEYFFAPGQSYEAKSTLFRIMSRARSSLSIVDDYLDEQIFDYVESLDQNVDVAMITGHKKSIFPTLLTAMQSERKNVQAKSCSSCHDRFLVVDKNEVWHLGCSINGLGGKASMITKIEDETERLRFLKALDDWWQSGADV